MGKYYFNTGGDAGASMLNTYLDMALPDNEQEQEDNQYEEYEYVVNQESDFISNLRQFDEEEQQKETISFEEKLAQYENMLNERFMELEERQNNLEAIASFNSEDYFKSLYDSENDFVPYNPYTSTNTTAPTENTLGMGAALNSSGQYTKDRIQRIIDRFSGGKAPLTADDFIEISAKYGVPIDLMLAQAAQESAFGTKGMAVRTKNIFNVGNNGNTGKTETQNSFKAGLERYARLIKTEYAENPNNITTAEIIKNRFTRPRKGGSYAEPDYTERVVSTLNTINSIK